MTETRRRKRTEASSSSSSHSAHSASEPLGGEAHYHDVLLQLQSEFARVVAALETRTASLEALNQELHTEVASLRNERTAASQREASYVTALREAQEQAAMANDESASQAALAATREHEWTTQCEQLRQQLQAQETERNAEREAHASDYERVVRELSRARAQLGDEQQRHAQMSQEIQLLQCRVDAAVKTSRSFEARLLQLKQLKKDEKHDLEAQLTHLKTRLEDKKEQNKYLAEALMDKEARRSARKDRDARELSAKCPAATATATAEVVKPASARYQLPETLDAEKKLRTHRYLYAGGSPLSGLVEDMCSQAPTSPTSSVSPTRSPRSLSTTATTTTTPTARSHRTTTTTTTMSSSRASSPLEARASARSRAPTSRSGESDRKKREMEILRRKLDACYFVDATESLSPH